MITLYIFIGIVYQLILLLLYRFAQKPKENFVSNGYVPVSIIVPFRNEEANLAHCLESICLNQYAEFEVICVDDHSSDASREKVVMMQEKFPQVQLRLLSNLGEGKKAAISHAVDMSIYDVILTTDSDCEVPSDWIMMMVERLGKHTQLVAGPVMSVKGEGYFKGFQQIDWASIGLVTRAAIYHNRPLMCSAANMLYRKAAFISVGGYSGNEQVLSGDDEFLLKKIAQNFGPSAIAYQAHVGALVYTEAMKTWRDLIQQRVRWASKWRQHGFSFHSWTAVVPALFQFTFLGLFFLPVLSPKLWWLASLLLILKLLVERFVLGAVLQSYGIFQPFRVWLLTSLIHPVYVVIVSIQTFYRKIEWKGRKSFS